MGGCFSLPGRATDDSINGVLQQPALSGRAKRLCIAICDFFLEIMAKTILMKGKLPNGPDGNLMVELSNAREATTNVQQEPANKGGVIIPDGAVCYCPGCDLFFASWMKLDSHLMEEHRGKKFRRAFKCSYCWAGFKHIKSLEKHVSAGKHSFPYRVSNITVSGEQCDQVFEVLEVPAGFQGNTVSLRHGVLAD